ncbi:MAG: type II TA system antitoxin MqsA family protein [Bacillota bacterium]
MERKTYCSNCDTKVDFVVSIEEVTRKVKDKEYTLSVKVPRCIHCQEELYVESIDTESQQLFFDAYRIEHQLPTVEQIVSTRKKLNLTQRDFSRLLGLGEISISRYELGSLPNSSSVNLIKSILEVEVLEQQLKANKDKLSSDSIASIDKYLIKFSDIAFTGNTRYNLEKFHQLAAYFVNLAQEANELIYPTKLNKLMFYTDFNYFNKFQHSITGSIYHKLTYGPVPNYFEFKYDMNEYMEIKRDEEKTIIYPKDVHYEDVLTQEEKNVAKAVYSHFINHNSKMISDASHEEEAWLETKTGDKISYYYAHDLKIKI